jgi:hypothetical protein
MACGGGCFSKFAVSWTCDPLSGSLLIVGIAPPQNICGKSESVDPKKTITETSKAAFTCVQLESVEPRNSTFHSRVSVEHWLVSRWE